MNISGKTIIYAGAVFAALNGMAWGAWRFGDDTGYRPVIKREFIGFINNEFKMAMDQAEQNTLAIIKNEFNYLEGKQEHGAPLTWEEKRDLCKNAQILEYPVQGCLKTGEPDLTETSPAQ